MNQSLISSFRSRFKQCIKSNVNVWNQRWQHFPQTYKGINPITSQKYASNRSIHTNTTTNTKASIDTLIVGGGPVGSSVAYHLSQLRNQSGKEITIIEQDPTYQSSSAVYSAGGIRQQFSLEENVRMSLYGRDFLRDASINLKSQALPHVDLGFQEYGYLFLTGTTEGVAQMKDNHDTQKKSGCTSLQLLSPMQLKQQFPWLNTDDLLLGSYGTMGEGWFDPWAYIQALKEKNKEMGVTYRHATVVGSTRDVETGKVLQVQIQDASSKHIETVSVNRVVNACGAQAGTFMDLLANEGSLRYPLPVKPRKRCIFFYHCTPDPNENEEQSIVPEIAPLTVDSSMVYFRSEGKQPGSGHFLCGVSPPEDQDDDCWDKQELEYADHDIFQETIWPALYHRVPAFGNIKVQSSWAGLYDYNTLDQNAIIDYHPELQNVLMVNGFSGHGLMMSPAAGMAAAELLEYDDEFRTLDLNVFRFDRFMEGGSPVYEMGII